MDKDKYYFDFVKVPLSSEIEERKQKKKRIIVTTLLCSLFLIFGLLIGLFFDSIIHPSLNADANNVFGEIEAILNKDWLYKDNYENLPLELEDKAFYGMSKFDEDQYTSYMSSKELNDFSTTINMNYVGIGVQYRTQDDYALIERVYVNSPAEIAGIKAGDTIIEVDHKSIKGLSTSEIKDLVLGEKGSEVIITILRDNTKYDMSVIRDELDNSVFCYVDNDYVVMELESFGNNTGKDIMSYLDNYLDYKKIIIDLRNNTGGYQTSVKEIAGLFIGNDKVYLRQADNKGNEVSDKTSCVKTYDNFEKIVLLVNQNTASAAEVFTICLKEQLDNVTIVGTTTYGKGVIQSTRMLRNGGALKYTSFYWYSPNGVSINNVGILPDIEVKLDDIVYEDYIDMKDDEVYEIDSVSNSVKIAQMCLDYLGYKIDRTDGYFDHSFEDALLSFESDTGIESDSSLNKTNYNIIVAHLIADLGNPTKDYQMHKAIELMEN